MPETPPPDSAPRGAGARDSGMLETRLRAAREAKGMSLIDVQQETRIPADVLQRLEDGRLLGDATFNPVYLKALLKAYASAVGLPADDVVAEFSPPADRLAAGPQHAVAVGTMPRPPGPPTPEPAPRPDAARPTDSVDAPGHPPDTGPKEAPAPVASATEATKEVAPATPARGRASKPAAAAPAPGATEPVAPAAAAAPPAAAAAPPREAPVPIVPSAPAVAAASTVRPAPAAAVGKHRVISADAARTPRAFDRSWGLIIGGTIALVSVFAIALYFLFRDRTPQPEPRPRPVAVDTATVRDTATASVEPAAPAGPTLAMPIRVAVTAGAGGLQNFRVTEEPNERLGHWIEEGQTRTFESSSALVIWGEEAEGLDGEATLELQGLRWVPADGRVLRIDQATGQRLLDSLAGTPAAPAPDG